MRIFIPIMMGGVSAALPAGLQLYFLSATAFSVATGMLLRQRRVRDYFGIMQLLNKEETERWGRRVRGEIDPNGAGVVDVKARSSPMLNLKKGTSLPQHMVTPDTKQYKSAEFERGMPRKASYNEKGQWLMKHYSPGSVMERMQSKRSEPARNSTMKVEEAKEPPKERQFQTRRKVNQRR
jgi:hypothetical protein